MKCLSCGSDNKEGAKFCKNCGTPLNQSTVQQSDGGNQSPIKERNIGNQSSPQDRAVNNQPPLNQVENTSKSSNKNTIIICATAIICVIIIAAAFIMISNNNSSSTVYSSNLNSGDDSDEVQESDDSSSDESASANVNNGVSFDEACSYFSDASTTVVGHVFDESDSNGDGYLSDSEYSDFKSLVKFTRKWAADITNNDYVDTPDLWNGDGTTKTRYCADHGRVAVGSDNRCQYCEQKGLDSRTRSGSTKYV